MHNTFQPVRFLHVAAGRAGSLLRFGMTAALLIVCTLWGTGPRAMANESVSKETRSASDLVQAARANREVFTSGFPGFRSNLTVHLDGTRYSGTMLYRPPRTVEIEFPDQAVPEWVTDRVRSMVMHRVPSDRLSESAAGLGKADDHPLGRQVFLADSYRSMYRIRDDRILVVNRTLGDERIVITVLDTVETESGRYLPKYVAVARYDKETGEVRESWSYVSQYHEIGGNYVPRSRAIAKVGQGATTTVFLEWSQTELLEPAAAE